LLKRTRNEKIFNVFNIIILFLFACLTIIPMLYVLKTSLELGGPRGLTVSIFPVRTTFLYYRMLINKQNIYTSFLVTLRITAAGTALSLALTSMCAFPLSVRKLPGQPFFTYMLIIPMMFSGGIVPGYLLIKYLGIMNTYWALIIPGCIGGWNMLLIRNYYWSVPDSLPESARIDGASEFTIYLRIMLPLSKPVLAAIGLIIGIGYYNSYFSALMYISDVRKYPFQLVLREMITLIQNMDNLMLQSGGSRDLLFDISTESVSSAMIIASVIPIMFIYPFLQKYFIKGIMIGSVKG